MLLNTTVVAVGWWATGASSLAAMMSCSNSARCVAKRRLPGVTLPTHIFKARWYEASRIQINYGRTDPLPRHVRNSEAVCPRVESLLVLGGPRRRPSDFLLRFSQIIPRQSDCWSRTESHIGQTVFNIVALIRSARSRGLGQGNFSFEQTESK